MDKILLVEDDISLGAALEFSLNDEGYVVAKAASIQEARDCLQKETYAVILLDVNLPDGSGYDFCKEIRAFLSVPIIFLTALEFRLLSYFLQNPNRTLKREEILKYISGSEDVYFDENTLSVYIKRLREKIEDDMKNPKFIITKRGIGYQWNAEVKKQ